MHLVSGAHEISSSHRDRGSVTGRPNHPHEIYDKFCFFSLSLSLSLPFPYLFFLFFFFFFFCQHFHSHTYNPRTLKVPFTRVCRNPRMHSTRVYTLVVYAFHFVQHSPCAFRATGWLRNLSSFLIIGLPLFFSFTRYFLPSFSVPFFFTIIFFFLEHPKNHESIR